MRIVSLAPFITDYLASIGKGAEIAGISHLCSVPSVAGPSGAGPASTGPAAAAPPPVVVTETGGFVSRGADALIERELCLDRVSAEKLLALAPDVILTSLPEEERVPPKLKTIAEDLSGRFGKKVAVESYFPRTLAGIYEAFEGIAKTAGAPQQGHDRTQRIQAQLLNWADNFYERMKNKKVSFVSSIKPLQLAGWWIPDMIRLCSAQPQNPKSGEPPVRIEWNDVIAFNPDVIIVAPQGESLQEAMAHFKLIEKYPSWDEIIAVKRGQVAFTDGIEHFYRPGPTIISSMGILVSAIAGMDSGYITERDQFQRLRYLEMQRHKL